MPIYSSNAADSFSDRKIKRARTMLRRTFERSVSYRQVDKYNPDGSITNNFPIQIWQSSNKKNNYMNFIAHPDNPVDYGAIFQLDNSKVIVVDLNSDNRISSDGMAYRCSNELKWKDGNDVIHTTPAFVNWKTIGKQDNEDINTQQGSPDVYIQITPDTDNIFENQRFIIANNVYKVSFINKGIGGNLALLGIDITQKDAQDDFSTGIAYNTYNNEIDSSEPSTSGNTYVFSDNEAIVNEGLTENITVYEYDGDTLLSTTFTFRIDNVDSSYYDLVATDNSVDITGLKYPESGLLVAINSNTLEEVSIPIEFKGLW